MLPFEQALLACHQGVPPHVTESKTKCPNCESSPAYRYEDSRQSSRARSAHLTSAAKFSLQHPVPFEPVPLEPLPSNPASIRQPILSEDAFGSLDGHPSNKTLSSMRMRDRSCHVTEPTRPCLHDAAAIRANVRITIVLVKRCGLGFPSYNTVHG